ncbi:MAG: PDZ domain-containing protein [Planctomycetota bacterium]
MRLRVAFLSVLVLTLATGIAGAQPPANADPSAAPSSTQTPGPTEPAPQQTNGDGEAASDHEAATEQAAKPVDSSLRMPTRTLREWADQLSHDSYLRREAASRHLIRGGREAIPILIDQLKSNDLEVVQRVVAILTRIADAEAPGESEQPGSAFDSLRRAAEKGVGVKSFLASSIINGFLEQRDFDAREQLAAAGIYIGFEDQALGSSKKERAVVRIDDGWNGSEKVLPWLRWVRGVNFAVVVGPAAQPKVVQWVVQVPGLESLVINDAEISTDSIRHIRRPHTINAFELRYVRLDEAKLQAIEQASIRNTLYLVGTGVSEERVEQMRAKLPGLDITLRRGGFLGVICYRPEGAYCQVDDITPGSGASQAGLQRGDIIIGIDGVRISRFEDLQKQVDTHIPGDDIQLRFRRGTQILEGTATLGKLENP